MIAAALFILSNLAPIFISADTSAWITEAMEVVPHGFRDPDSAKFRNIAINVGIDGNHYVCGEVNGTNLYGAYVGFTPFSYDVETKTAINYSYDDLDTMRLLVKADCGEAWMLQVLDLPKKIIRHHIR